MSRLLDSRVEADVDPIRLGLAIELDRVTDCGRNPGASPAYPEGGMVRRYADELGMDVEALLACA